MFGFLNDVIMYTSKQNWNERAQAIDRERKKKVSERRRVRVRQVYIFSLFIFPPVDGHIITTVQQSLLPCHTWWPFLKMLLTQDAVQGLVRANGGLGEHQRLFRLNGLLSVTLLAGLVCCLKRHLKFSDQHHGVLSSSERRDAPIRCDGLLTDLMALQKECVWWSVCIPCKMVSLCAWWWRRASTRLSWTSRMIRAEDAASRPFFTEYTLSDGYICDNLFYYLKNNFPYNQIAQDMCLVNQLFQLWSQAHVTGLLGFAEPQHLFNSFEWPPP